MQRLTMACETPVLVDDDVYEWAQEFHWSLSNGYPRRHVTSTRHGSRDGCESYLHREIMHYPIGFVHHKDENPLNCQRDNLEVLSPAAHIALHGIGESTRQRLRRVGPRSKSGYKGVSWHKAQGRWTAQLSIGGKNYQFGYADDPEEAAVIYDSAVIAFLPAGTYTNLIPFEENRASKKGSHRDE